MATHDANPARPVIIVETPPTPNGDLHIGHLAGPFLGADIQARYLRTRDRRVVFATGTDDSQTYVLAAARRQGSTPESVAAKSHEEIGRTLRLAGISVDGYAPYDQAYRSTVLDFVSRLYDMGKFEFRRKPFPYSERTGEFLVEGLVSGLCPACVTESRGGVCEMCGHPNNFDELIEPRSTLDPTDHLTTRDARVLVLPMERYREEITAYYRGREPHLRPRTVRFLRAALARPLPDFPVTYPISYGLPAPFPGTQGQTINSWVEGIPAVQYCTSFADQRTGYAKPAGRNLLLAEHDPEIIYFIGSDIVYFWGLTHLALLLAHEGRYALPNVIVSNEFYELENEKFSTTRGHVVFMGDLLPGISRDAVRLHLALTGPEHQRTNFSMAALTTIAQRRLIEPWNELATALNKASAGRGQLPVSDAASTKAKALLARFADYYEITGYAPSNAASFLLAQLARLRDAAESLDGLPDERLTESLGDLFIEVRVLIAGAAPILIDLADQVYQRDGWDGTFDPAMVDVPFVKPFALPILDEIDADRLRSLADSGL